MFFGGKIIAFHQLTAHSELAYGCAGTGVKGGA